MLPQPSFSICLASARLTLQTGLLALLLTAVLPVWAAVQGDAGATSSGRVDINLVTGLNVRISGLDDIPLGTWSGSGDVEGNDDLCIGRTGVGFFGTGAYRVLATGDGEPGDPAAFTLSNGSRQLYYDAFFNDQTGIADRQPLVPGVALTAQQGFGFAQVLNYLFGCSVANANISVRVPETTLRGAAGTYSGTLTLLLIPE